MRPRVVDRKQEEKTTGKYLDGREILTGTTQEIERMGTKKYREDIRIKKEVDSKEKKNKCIE